MDRNVATFNTESEKYFRDRPRYPLALYERIVEQCIHRGTAWDSGCGNGQVAVDLVPYFKTIHATDINENQIANAFNHKKIHYSVQRSEQTNFKDRSFDLVCVAQCLHWFELDTFFREVYRLLKVDGIFACWGYGFFSVRDDIDQMIRERLLDPIAAYWSERNRLVIRGYADVVFPFDKIEIPGVEMIMSWTRRDLLRYLDTWSAVKLYDERNGGSIVDRLDERLALVWEAAEAKPVKMDFAWYVGKKIGGRRGVDYHHSADRPGYAAQT